MKHSAGIATLSALLALASAIPANAAKGVRTDAGNNWDNCGSEVPCVSLPDGLVVDPLGVAPSLGSTSTGPESDIDSDDNGSVDGPGHDSLNGSVQTGWTDHVPALSRSWINEGLVDPDAEFRPLDGELTYAQVLFFDLAGAIADPDNDLPFVLETVYSPSGAALGLNTVEAGAWEIAFTYDFTKFPIDLDPTSIFASLVWDGNLYTADYSTLSTPAAASFVFYGGVLHAPTTGWEVRPVTSVPEPSTLMLLLLGLAGVIGSYYLRGRRTAARLASA